MKLRPLSKYCTVDESFKQTVTVCVCDHQDWIEFEEIADLEERAKSLFFEKENEEEVQKSQAAAKEKEFQSVKATKDQVGEVSLVTSQLWSFISQSWTSVIKDSQPHSETLEIKQSASCSHVEGRNPVTASKCYFTTYFRIAHYLQ